MIKFENQLNTVEWVKIRNFLKKNIRSNHPILNKRFFFWQFKRKKKTTGFLFKRKKKNY